MIVVTGIRNGTRSATTSRASLCEQRDILCAYPLLHTLHGLKTRDFERPIMSTSVLTTTCYYSHANAR